MKITKEQIEVVGGLAVIFIIICAIALLIGTSYSVTIWIPLYIALPLLGIIYGLIVCIGCLLLEDHLDSLEKPL